VCYNYFYHFYSKITEENNKVFSYNKFGKIRDRNYIMNKSVFIPSFFYILKTSDYYSDGIMGNLMYFVLANLIIALLLLIINSYFSISVKYLDKGGGFECGFTSFIQTRERFNVIFYRVSLLFLVFDLEIILIFPYTVIYQKNQNISKNNVIAFLYILIVGFIYELKEGALNIVKKAHST
jgi:NADH:ubiquinone oxidoreductase subunit 3 (subunit A)